MCINDTDIRKISHLQYWNRLVNIFMFDFAVEIVWSVGFPSLEFIRLLEAHVQQNSIHVHCMQQLKFKTNLNT